MIDTLYILLEYHQLTYGSDVYIYKQTQTFYGIIMEFLKTRDDNMMIIWWYNRIPYYYNGVRFDNMIMIHMTPGFPWPDVLDLRSSLLLWAMPWRNCWGDRPHQRTVAGRMRIETLVKRPFLLPPGRACYIHVLLKSALHFFSAPCSAS